MRTTTLVPLMFLACRAAPAALPTHTLLLHEDGVENAYPRPSSDGRRLVYQSNRTGHWQLWSMDVETGAQTRLTNDAHENNFVDLAADDQWIAFVSNRDGNEEIYRMRTDGTALERLTDDPARDIHPYFAPDGASILFNSTRGNGSLDLYRMTLADKAVERLTDTTHSDTCARYSPDASTIVFLRNDETMDDVMLMDVASGRLSNLTNTPLVMDGWPVFSGDGRWIYYSTTLTGAHSVHRVHPDGTGDEVLTAAPHDEEHGRAVPTRDGRSLVFNRRKGEAIDIVVLALP